MREPDLVIVGRRKSEFERVARAFEDAHGADRVYSVPADVSTADRAHRVVEAAQGRWAAVDVLVENAGQPAHDPVMDDDDVWHYDFDPKFMAAVRLMRLLDPTMREARGASSTS